VSNWWTRAAGILPAIQLQTAAQRQASFLRILNLGWLVVGLVAVISLPFYPEEWRLLTTIAAVTGATFLSVGQLNRRGYGRAAGMAFVVAVDAACYLFFVIEALERGAAQAVSTHATMLMMMGLAIVFAGPLVDRRAPFGFALVNSLILVLTIQAVAPGGNPRFSIHVFWWLLALSTWTYERMLASAFAELQSVLADREALIGELEQRNAELERFTYTVSHDLKAPLVTIGGFASYLERAAGTGDLERTRLDAGRIRAATRQMHELLENLLRLARAGRRLGRTASWPFDAIVREALETLAGRLALSRVSVEIAEALPSIYGDRDRLVELVQNLVDNAAKFMGDQQVPKVWIGAREDDGRQVFFVKDNGIGIAPPYRETVFGLFEKLDAGSEGAGVGLALVKRIVELHGGRIWVESEGAGGGSRFCFTLAAAPAPGSIVASAVDA
jgi:signal transduction histidine kinase